MTQHSPAQHYIGTKQIQAWPQDKDGQPGYAVQYPDGYTSWSPKDVFEAAYLPMGHVDDLEPHKQRVVGEKVQLDDKIAKLAAFVGGKVFAGLPDAEQERLTVQLGAMREYSEILGHRIAGTALEVEPDTSPMGIAGTTNPDGSTNVAAGFLVHGAVSNPDVFPQMAHLALENYLKRGKVGHDFQHEATGLTVSLALFGKDVE